MPQTEPTRPNPTVPGRPCPAAGALSIVGEKWSLLVVRELLFGVHRFDAIARNTGAPRDRLTARLRTLQEAGIVERRAYSRHPPRHEYHLTDAGRGLAPVVTALAQWGSTWLYDEPPVVFHHRDHVAALDTTPICTACGSPADHLTPRTA